MAAVLAVVAAATVYVVATTDNHQSPSLSVAAGAFASGDRLDAGIERAIFSPDASRVLGVGPDGVGLVQRGRLDLITEPGSSAVDATWMPDGASILVAEGPVIIDRLTVLTLDGEVKGVARLDAPFSVGAGNGMTVDSRGARAVVTTERRDPIGGRRRLDLALVDLPTGHVTALTDTADANEASPLFVDDSHVAFSRDGALMELDLASRAERALTDNASGARPVGVIQDGRLVYAATREGRTRVFAAKATPMGTFSVATTVWSVDRSGSRAIVSQPETAPTGTTELRLRAVTLHPPSPG